ncbi:OLC1v1006423C1 [Oldenlandia corymbosa var. corymbosa]|uniref:OLC1v1006423C1 n=1 Tax=Oldenlandia corymbosa var. corymbosa TaxID=529605 RepID=A0AAV1DJZ3_OLDCO|nr:OLC1v1006423C1 [Oldenlandia corymbosa var. corymbosa]
MKMKKAITTLSPFKSKLFSPCKKVVKFSKLKLRKPICIRGLRICHPRRRRKNPRKTPTLRKRVSKAITNAFFPVFNCFKTSKTPLLRNRVIKVFPGVLHCFKRRSSGDMNRVMELKSFSDAGYIEAPFPSPITPAYVKLCAANKKRGIPLSGCPEEEDVQDACRSFENYLVEMIVEEGKMRDLMDVEEMLHCWKNLKSPIFIDLVCRFYGELCRDLFSNN